MMKDILVRPMCSILEVSKKHKVPNKRYLTRGFLNELTEKGLLISYKSILHLDEQKQYIILPIIILVNIILA